MNIVYLLMFDHDLHDQFHCHLVLHELVEDRLELVSVDEEEVKYSPDRFH